MGSPFPTPILMGFSLASSTSIYRVSEGPGKEEKVEQKGLKVSIARLLLNARPWWRAKQETSPTAGSNTRYTFLEVSLLYHFLGILSEC